MNTQQRKRTLKTVQRLRRYHLTPDLNLIAHSLSILLAEPQPPRRDHTAITDLTDDIFWDPQSLSPHTT